MYQYLIKLQDMLSAPAMQMAAKWNQLLGGMDRVQQRVTGAFRRNWKRVGDVFGGASNEAGRLRKEINSLHALRNFHMKVDSSEYVEAGKRLDELRAKLQSLGGGKGGGGGFGGFGRKAAGLVGALGGGLPGMLMAGGVYGAAAYGLSQAGQAVAQRTVAPAMTRQMQEFSLGFQMGDQSAGKALSEEIKKLAIANPFLKADEAFKITPALLTAGFKGTEIPDKLNMLTNLSTMSGKSLEEIALQYKQIKMNGIAQWEELGQIADKLPVMRELMKLTGAKDIISLRKLIEDRKVTFEMVDKALGNIRGAKDFGQQASGQSMAKYNTLVESFQERLIALGTRALPMVNKGLEWLVVAFERMAPYHDALFRLIGAFSPLFEALGMLLQAFGVLDKNMQLSTGFVSGFAMAIELLRIPIEGISRLIRDVVGLFTGDGIVGKVFQTMFPQLKLLSAINNAKLKGQSNMDADQLGNYYAQRDGDRPFQGNRQGGGKGGGASLGQAAGLDATVSGAAKKTVIVNIQNLIQKSEIHVAQYGEALGDLEGRIIDTLHRAVQSATANMNA